MLGIFSRLVDTSIAAGIFIIAILLIRLIFRKMPGRVSCFLWLLVGLRLALPFSFANIFEKLFRVSIKTPSVLDKISVQRPVPLHHSEAVHAVVSGHAAVPYTEAAPAAAAAVSFDFRSLAAVVWIIGMELILAYIIRSCISLRSRLSTATKDDGGVYRSEAVSAPFIFGILRPRIYFPYSIPEQDIPYALKHEKTHLKNHDHIAKAAGFAILAVYWFNPLVWAAFITFCRDTELACDECVIAQMEKNERKKYSYALLSCSMTPRPSGTVGKFAAKLCPVSFGEIGVKERIRKIMKYNKPASSTRIIAFALCLILSVGMLMLPIGGCSDAKTEVVGAAPKATTDIETPDVPASREGAVDEPSERVLNDDGSIAMRYIHTSDFASDIEQVFTLDSGITKVTASCTDGTMPEPDGNGRTSYLCAPAGSATYPGNWFEWTPQVLDSSFSAASESGSAVITFTAYSGDDAVFSGTINAAAQDGNYTFSSSDCTLSVGDNFDIIVK